MEKELEIEREKTRKSGENGLRDMGSGEEKKGRNAEWNGKGERERGYGIELREKGLNIAAA